MSFVGWLDFSEAEQRRAREILQMFGDPGTVDDLGIGTLRDAISNKLFPGASVIQTRARYFLFIPWIFENAARGQSKSVLERAEFLERKLIVALNDSGAHEGLIGRQAGVSVRTLPSTIYWSGLASYGVFRVPGMTRSEYAKRARAQIRRSAASREEELADREEGYWHGDIPDPPDGFFDFTYADFELTPEESRWLSERVLSWELEHGTCLLGDYVRALRRGQCTLPKQFWDGRLPEGTDVHTRRLVHHAERFSLLAEGAAIVYNLMLHEQRDDEDHADQDRVIALRAALAEWADEAGDADINAWTGERDDFFATVDPALRTPVLTRRFVNQLMDAMAAGRLARLHRDDGFRRLIQTREEQHKKTLARFRGGPRLKTWQGASGLNRLDYRWGQVRRFLSDIEAGLARSKRGRGRSHAPH